MFSDDLEIGEFRQPFTTFACVVFASVLCQIYNSCLETEFACAIPHGRSYSELRNFMSFQKICFPSAFFALASANERCKIDCNVPILRGEGRGGGGRTSCFTPIVILLVYFQFCNTNLNIVESRRTIRHFPYKTMISFQIRRSWRCMKNSPLRDSSDFQKY